MKRIEYYFRTTMLFAFFSPLGLIAQSGDGKNKSSAEGLFFLENLALLSGFLIVLIGLSVIIRLAFLLLRIKKHELMGGDEPFAEIPDQESRYSLQKVFDYANSMVPVAKESTIDLGHDYDGIRELDNRLPPWWLGIMYGSMIFAVIYLYYYHFSGNDWSSEQEYAMAVAVGEQEKADYLYRMGNNIDESNVTTLDDQESMDKALELYKLNCVACHGIFGEGGVGPNLTDNYWINGGSITDIFTTIKYGVPDKGMIAWKAQLPPKAMQQLASYILTLQGTNPDNGKDPQGKLYQAESGD